MRDRVVVGTVKSQSALSWHLQHFGLSMAKEGEKKLRRRLAERGILPREDQREWAEERRRGQILKRKIAAEGALEREANREKRRRARLAALSQKREEEEEDSASAGGSGEDGGSVLHSREHLKSKLSWVSDY